jgi:hypothetical protein
MSNKWRGLHGPITAEAAERETDRLFDHPVRPMSPETRALFTRIVTREARNSAATPREVAPAHADE